MSATVKPGGTGRDSGTSSTPGGNSSNPGNFREDVDINTDSGSSSSSGGSGGSNGYSGDSGESGSAAAETQTAPSTVAATSSPASSMAASAASSLNSKDQSDRSQAQANATSAPSAIDASDIAPSFSSDTGSRTVAGSPVPRSGSGQSSYRANSVNPTAPQSDSKMAPIKGFSMKLGKKKQTRNQGNTRSSEQDKAANEKNKETAGYSQRENGPKDKEEEKKQQHSSAFGGMRGRGQEPADSPIPSQVAREVSEKPASESKASSDKRSEGARFNTYNRSSVYLPDSSMDPEKAGRIFGYGPTTRENDLYMDDRFRNVGLVREEKEDGSVETDEEMYERLMADARGSKWLMDRDVKEAIADTSNDVMKRLIRRYAGEKDDFVSRPEPRKYMPAREYNEWGEYAQSDISRQDKVQDRFKRSREATIRRLVNPYKVRFSGDHWGSYTIAGEEGPIGVKDLHRWTHSNTVQKSLNKIQKLYDCSESAATTLMQCVASMGVDNSGKIMGTKASEFQISDDIAAKLANQIAASQAAYGHPFGVAGTYTIIGGTECFPSGYIPKYLLAELNRSKQSALHGRTVDELANAAKNQWLNKTLPDMLRMTYDNDRLDQREAVYNFVRACLDVDYTQAGPRQLEEYGLDPMDQHNTLPEIRAQYVIDEAKKNKVKLDPDFVQSLHEQRKGRVASEARKNIEDDFKASREAGKFSQLCQATASTMRFFGVAGNPAIMFGAWAEKAKGEIATNFANSCISKSYARKLRESGLSDLEANAIVEQYSPSQKLKEAFDTDEAIEAVDVLMTLMSLGGVDCVKLFAVENSNSLTGIDKGDMIDFMNKYVRGKEKEANESGDKTKLVDVNQMMVRLSDLTNMMLTGGGFTKHLDAQRVLQNIMLIQLGKKVNGDTEALDSAAIESALRIQNVGNVLLDLVIEGDGIDAVGAVNQLNMGRRSPIAAMTEQFFSEHGITDFLYAMAIDKYLSFGIKLIELYFPMSSTCEYLIAKKLIAKVGGERDLSKISPELGKYKRIFVQNTMSAADADGLKKCLFYDLAQLGTTGSIALFWFVLHAIMDSLDDDDDEPDAAQVASAVEYDYGALGKWTPAWWTYDFMGWGYGLGQSMWASFKTGDTKIGWDVFVNSTADALSGSAIIDNIGFVSEAATDAMVMYNLATNPDYVAPANWNADRLMTYAQGAFARFARNMTPGVINSIRSESLLWGQNALDRSAWMYYTDDQGNTAYLDEADPGQYNEALMRQWAKNNILYGALLDLGRTVFGTNQYNENTGYLFWEMPIAEKADPVAMGWYDKFNIPDDADAATKETAARELMEFLQGVESKEWLLSQGFVLAPSAAENLKEYCLGKKIEVELYYLENDATEDYSITSRLAQLNMQQKKAEYQNILDTWIFASDVPKSIPKYQKLLSDSETNYVWPDGSPSNAIEYFLNMDKVTKITIPLGNAPTSIFPVSRVRDAYDVNGNESYNQETSLGWQTKFTDNDWILDQIGDREIAMGQDEGKKIADIIMGSQDPFDKDLSADRRVDTARQEDMVLGKRAYVYNEEKGEYSEATEEDMKAAAARYGIDYDEFEKKREAVYSGNYGSSSGGYGSRSYGSRSYSKSYGSGSSYSKSSSSYNPKIYSSNQRVYNTKAQGMDVRTPYKASTTYLRPGFSTKGSREAYKRSDI